ncbi:hypothetical protein D3C85_1837090 [compost metagenome]
MPARASSAAMAQKRLSSPMRTRLMDAVSGTRRRMAKSLVPSASPAVGVLVRMRRSSVLGNASAHLRWNSVVCRPSADQA